MPVVVEFIEGPFWTFSVIVFVIGVSYRLFSILRLGVKADLAVAHAGSSGGALRTLFGRFVPRREFVRQALFVTIAGYAFHIGLFILVFFAEPHVHFFAERMLGFGWTPVPYWAFMLSAILALAGMVALWMRRLLDPVRKKISTIDDHISAILIIVVILTGFMAMQKTYDVPRVMHLLSAELLLIYFPFSRLMHTFTFVISRCYTGASFARRGVKA